MAIAIPFPLPGKGFALNSKVRVNLDFIVSKFNEFNTGTATWDTVGVGYPGQLTGTATFWNAVTAYYVTLQAGATTANATYTLPITIPTGGSGTKHLMLCDGAGVMSFDPSEFSSPGDANGVLICSAASDGTILKLITGTAGRGFLTMPMGNTTPPLFVDLLGTTNQITVTTNASDTTLSLPQNIATNSAVTFSTVDVGIGGLANPAVFIGDTSSGVRQGWGLYGDSNYLYISGHTGVNPTPNDVSLLTISHVGAVGLTGSLTLSSNKNIILTDDTTNTVTVALPSAVTSYTLTLPIDDGNTGQCLVTDGSGVTSWGTPSGTGANTTLNNLTDTVAINKNLNNFSAGTITASLTGAASLNLLLTGGTLTGNVTLANAKALIFTELLAGVDTISVRAPDSVTASYALQLPPAVAGAGQVLTDVAGNGILSWTTPTGSGATTTLNNLGSTAVNAHIIPGADSNISLGSTGKRWLETYSDSFIGTDVSINGALDVTNAPGYGLLRIDATANAGDTTTLVTNASQAAARTYTIPDAGASASFVMTEGTQTINGAKTLGNALLLTDGAAATPSLSFGTDTNTGIYLKGTNSLGIVTNGTNALDISAAGEVTQPLQPSFLVTAPSNTADVTGDGTEHIMELDTEVYDQGSDFNTGTYTFTAPVTGRYLLCASVRFSGILDAHTYAYLLITTSNRNYTADDNNPTAATYSVSGMTISTVADMDANDTAKLGTGVGGSTKVCEVSADATRNFFSGSLIN